MPRDAIDRWKRQIRAQWYRVRYYGIQLTRIEICAIWHAISKFPRCRLLVFGLGHDAPMWQRINHNGLTLFIEDQKDWYERTLRRYPDILARLVRYQTGLSRWKQFLDDPLPLQFSTPLPSAD